METSTLITRNKRLISILAIVTFLLMVPLIAMQFTSEVRWDETDFIVAGTLLLTTGLLFELAMRKGGNTSYRAGAGVAIFTTLILIWMNLAVGLIGSENNPANLLYIGVLAILLIGIGIARFQAQGMARALFATAIAQFLVPLLAIAIWQPGFGGAGMIGVLFLNTIFALLWTGSGLLFRHATVNKKISQRAIC